MKVYIDFLTSTISTTSLKFVFLEEMNFEKMNIAENGIYMVSVYIIGTQEILGTQKVIVQH